MTKAIQDCLCPEFSTTRSPYSTNTSSSKVLLPDVCKFEQRGVVKGLGNKREPEHNTRPVARGNKLVVERGNKQVVVQGSTLELGNKSFVR